MKKSILSNKRQQFPLSVEVDEELDNLANTINKKPADLRRDVLTAFSGVPADKFYIALGKIQELANTSKKTA